MCYHVSTPKKQKLKDILPGHVIVEDYAVYNYVTGFVHPELPVMTDAEPHRIQAVRWGLIPSWAKDEQIANHTLNAVSETAFTKPSFRDSIRKRRCLIWIDGFFEWTHIGRKKEPHYIYMPEHRPFALGGLWSDWHSPVGENIRTCSILTTAANDLLSVIHNSKKRMPLILDEDKWDIWLNDDATEEAVKALLKPYRDGVLEDKIIKGSPADWDIHSLNE